MGSSAIQTSSVVDSTLEIIDISVVPDSLRREIHVAVAESSSPHIDRFVEGQPASSEMVINTLLPMQYCVHLESKVLKISKSLFTTGVGCGRMECHSTEFS